MKRLLHIWKLERRLRRLEQDLATWHERWKQVPKHDKLGNRIWVERIERTSHDIELTKLKLHALRNP